VAASKENPFSPDAVATNREGRLTDDQARAWQQVVLDQQKGIRRGALVPIAIGIVLLVVSGPAASAAERHLVGFGSFLIAAVMLMASGRGRLAADVREGRVEAVEGAIGKHVFRTGARSAGTRHFLDIASVHLRTSRVRYDAAPEAGIVRAYYFPRSLRVVNLEPLPDRPLAPGAAGVRQVFAEFADGIKRHDATAMAEARASAAALGHIIAGAVQPDGVQPEGARSGGDAGGDTGSPPLAEAIRGSWSNPLMTVTFGDAGAATVVLMNGTRRAGHWSVDGDGRLLTDAAGGMAPVDARIAGNRLTIVFDGRSVAFTRVP
jgi:hypothetical protein